MLHTPSARERERERASDRSRRVAEHLWIHKGASSYYASLRVMCGDSAHTLRLLYLSRQHTRSTLNMFGARTCAMRARVWDNNVSLVRALIHFIYKLRPLARAFPSYHHTQRRGGGRIFSLVVYLSVYKQNEIDTRRAWYTERRSYVSQRQNDNTPKKKNNMQSSAVRGA